MNHTNLKTVAPTNRANYRVAAKFIEYKKNSHTYNDNLWSSSASKKRLMRSIHESYLTFAPTNMYLLKRTLLK